MQLDCREIKNLFSPYLDGELDAHDGDRLREHLAHCRECRLELEAWRNISLNVRDLASSPLAAPPGFAAQVMGSIQPGQAKKPFYQTRRLFKVAAGIAATLVLAVSPYFITLERSLQMVEVNPPISEEQPVDSDWPNPNTVADPTDNFNTAPSDTVPTTVDSAADADANSGNNNALPPASGDIPAESTAPADSQPGAEVTTPPPGNTEYVLTSDSVVSSLLVVKADAVDAAENKARELALKLDAAFVSIGKENNGETARSSYKITVSSTQADKLITQLSALGEVVNYQSEKQDLSDKYTESRARWLSLQNQRRETTDSTELKQLDAQIKALDSQLKEWNQQTQKQTIVLWLQDY
ncbi:MAG: zf-HC2 domain-containing protein [Syntrophomonadaceae bacterium]|jgi:hypothetical protein|nr:zf-HC2 domain-containing protein [Syntrophomonadaceae bacterium]